jgi:translocation and assembly module TamB
MGLRNSGFITEKLTSTFGLDQMSITGSNAQTASLIVGKYLNPRLYLSYGLGIFDKISTAKLRYDLSRRFSVEAERGSESGVDIFYKIEK